MIFNIVSLFVAFIIGSSIKVFGNLQFTGMDGGVLVNSAYMSFLGYKPYVDFMTAVPPLFLMGGGLAFKVFGLSWNSIVLAAAIFSSLTFLLHVYLLKKIGFGKVLSIITALYVQSITVVIRGYWYYNFITIITAILFISSSILYLKDQNNIKNRMILILITSFLFLVKVNIAAPLLILTYLFLLFSTTNKKYTFIIILLSLFLSLLFLFFFNINPLDMIENYMISSSRALSFDGWISFIFLNQRWEVKESFLFFLPILIAFFVSTIDSIFITRHIQKNKFVLVLPLISIIIGIIALGTNNDFNMTDGSLVIFGIILSIFFWQKQSKDIFLKKLIDGLSFITIVAFTISGFYKGYDRFGLREGLAPNQRGVEFFFDGSSEKPPLANISDSFFFNTLKAGPLFNNTTKNICQALPSQTLKTRDNPVITQQTNYPTKKLNKF